MNTDIIKSLYFLFYRIINIIRACHLPNRKPWKCTILSINATKRDNVTHTCCYLLNCRAQCSSLNAYDSACNLHVESRHVTKHFTIESLTRCYILTGTWMKQFFCDHVWRYAPKRNGIGYKPRLFLNFSRLGTGATWYIVVITIVYRLDMVLTFWFNNKIKMH